MTGRRARFPVVAEAMAGMLATPLWYFGVWIIVTGLLLVAPVLRGRLLAEHLHQQDAAAEHGAYISVITLEQPPATGTGRVVGTSGGVAAPGSATAPGVPAAGSGLPGGRGRPARPR